MAGIFIAQMIVMSLGMHYGEKLMCSLRGSRPNGGKDGS